MNESKYFKNKLFGKFKFGGYIMIGVAGKKQGTN